MLLDIGAGEVFAIVVLAAVLLGPEKVPALAKKAGRVLSFLRRVANTATDQIKSELGPEYADLTLSDLKPKNLVQKIIPDDVQDEITSLRAELASMRAEVAQLQHETANDVRETVEEAREATVVPGWNDKAGAKSFYDSLAEMTGHTERSKAAEAAAISEVGPAETVSIEDRTMTEILPPAG